MKATPTAQVASMLRNTMLNLKQRKSVSLAQIRKHLEANYSTKLDTTNKKRLATALKGLVQTGKVEKTPAGVYKLKRPRTRRETKQRCLTDVAARSQQAIARHTPDTTGADTTEDVVGHTDVADPTIDAGATPGAAASFPRATARHTLDTIGVTGDVVGEARGNEGTQHDEPQANLHHLQLCISPHVTIVT